jgi:hypothetical protein
MRDEKIKKAMKKVLDRQLIERNSLQKKLDYQEHE